MSGFEKITTLKIFTDGGARGNPGPAACSVSVEDGVGSGIIFETGRFLGQTTNNIAEYQGQIMALEWLLQQNLPLLKSVSLFSDSELLVKQIAGEYRVKNANLLPLYLKTTELLKSARTKFKCPIILSHVFRTQNFRADLLVNQTLDNLPNADI